MTLLTKYLARLSLGDVFGVAVVIPLLLALLVSWSAHIEPFTGFALVFLGFAVLGLVVRVAAEHWRRAAKEQA
jgi:hypothetical protein